MNKRTKTLLSTGAVLGALVLLLVAPATAQTNATYYNNSSGVVQSDSPENATFENILDMAVSLSPSLIGTGEQDPSKTGFEGVLLTGLVYGGSTVVAMAATSVGPIGGSILGVLVSYGFVDLGFAPDWIKPLLLLGIGALAFLMFRRVVDN
jgi:hypothetical protein